jgi:hypothetical protein
MRCSPVAMASHRLEEFLKRDMCAYLSRAALALLAEDGVIARGMQPVLEDAVRQRACVTADAHMLLRDMTRWRT